jgi:hypothetical protein
MLAAVGVPSTYLIIHTENKHFLSDFASANQANHVILQVPLPGDTLWLECTYPELPLGYVHRKIAGHDALRVTPQGGVLCRLPQYADSLNTQVNHAVINLNADGTAVIDNRQTSRLLQYEDLFTIRMLEPDKQKDRIRNGIRLAQAHVDGLHIQEQKTRNPQITLSYNIRSDQYAARTGKRLFVPLNVFHRTFSVPADDPAERTNDIEIDYGYEDIDSIRIVLPTGTKIESMSKTNDLHTRFGSFHTVITPEKDNTFLLVQRLLMHSGTFSKEYYREFQDFRKQIAAQYKIRIVLKTAS